VKTRRGDFKILLVNPPVGPEEIYGEYGVAAPCLPPLGLCYLAAVLEKNGFVKIEIIDAVLERISFKELGRKIKKCRPDLVGVTSTTASFYQAARTISLCKKADKRIVTVLGGAHISALPERTFKESPGLDVGVFGEGEKTFLEVVEKVSQGKSLNRVKGVVFRKQKRTVVNSPRKPVSNLDVLPFPARHLLKDPRLYKHTPFRGKGFTVSVVTSRGCSFACSFCDQSVFGRAWRGHSASYVVDEVTHLQERYGVDFISFEDDNFLLSRKRAIEICRLLLEKKLTLKWGCSARADSLDRELLVWLKKAGCANIFIGIESGSERILKLMNKKESLREIRKAVGLIKSVGINVYASFILGVPTETRKEIEQSVDFACSLPLDGASFFIYTPYPKTSFASLAKHHGAVSKDWRDYSAHPQRLAFIPDGFSESELLSLQRRAYFRFYGRVRFLLKHFRLLFDRRMWKSGLIIFKNRFFASTF
jgi:radical SAM superfamily enzyme YgiQ (UPF0313 family)